MTAPALPAKPLLFISHKHADHEIAKALADFIKNRTGAQVRIHVSSHPDYSGPSSGRFLNEQLRTTLWQTEALILIYTSADQNWSYCLWECGVATNEHHPNRNIIILQCGEEVPAVYEGCLTTKANDFQSVRKLVGEIFMGPDFFAGRGRPVTDFTEKDCDDAAKDLHEIFVGLLSNLQRPESWSPWPLLRVELPGDDVRALVSIRDRAVANSLVSEKATIVGCNSELPRLFGKTRIETDIPLSALLPNSGLDPEWFESCCDQIADFVASREPVVHLAFGRFVHSCCDWSEAQLRQEQNRIRDIVCRSFRPARDSRDGQDGFHR